MTTNVTAGATTTTVTGRRRRLPGPKVLHRTSLALLAAVLLVALAAALPAYRDYQLAQVGYYAVAVAGLTVLTGYNGQISLGHGALMAVGAYTTALVLLHLHWPLAVALLLATLVTAVGGLFVGAVAARLRGPYLAGATLAFAVGLPGLANHYSSVLGGETGLSVLVVPPASLGLDFPTERWQAWISVVAAAIAFLLLGNLVSSRLGRTLRAVRDDEVSAALSGLHVARLQVVAFIVSAAAAGLAGGLLAVVVTLANPATFSLALSLALLTAVILGGVGGLGGAVWGALAIVYLPSWLAGLASPSGKVGQNLPLLVYGLVLIALMRFAPFGIQGGLRLLLRRARRLLQG